MGVTGAGKTTVGMLLANELGWQFADADSFHSEANKEKMRQGIPLEDADRQPWLEAMRKAISDWVAGSKNVVLACSSLKRSYRELLAVSHRGKVRISQGRLRDNLRAAALAAWTFCHRKNPQQSIREFRGANRRGCREDR